MVRFEVGAADVASTVRLARDTATGRALVVERRVRSERLRQLQALPPSTSVAPFERSRDNHRLQLVHPAPLELAIPVDEFDVVQAIGSMLDGLAWLHAHGVAHGAVDAMALTSGPTGGRLSLAGAFGVAKATPEDDVYAASVLAYRMLVDGGAGSVVADDVRLEQCASPAVAEAVRAGLHPDGARRPGAALLATMVRGEFLLPISQPVVREPLLVRLHATLTQVLRTYGGICTAGVSAALAIVVLIASFASADQRDLAPTAMISLAEEPMTASVLSARVERVPVPSSTIAPASVAVTAPDESASTGSSREVAPPVVALASASLEPDDQPRPTTTTTTTAPPPAHTTTVVAKPVSTTSTTAATTVTTRRATSTTTTTTVAKPAKGKGKGSNKSDDDGDDD